jgi:hypothetical protein
MNGGTQSVLAMPPHPSFAHHVARISEAQSGNDLKVCSAARLCPPRRSAILLNLQAPHQPHQNQPE